MEILGFSPSRGLREASFFPPNKLPRIVWKDRAARARVNAPMIALTRTFPLQQVNPGSLPLSGVLTEYFAVSSFHPDRFTFVFAHTFFLSLARRHLRLPLLVADIVAVYVCDGAC